LVSDAASEAAMKVTNIAEAKATLSKLVERVLEGEEIIIGKAGKPVSRLVPFDRDASPRDLDQGVWRARIWMADDFDELPANLLAGFAGDDEPAP
jgi:prevent-host-death family protein